MHTDPKDSNDKRYYDASEDGIGGLSGIRCEPNLAFVPTVIDSSEVRFMQILRH
jgi:hypothetical protein